MTDTKPKTLNDLKAMDPALAGHVSSLCATSSPSWGEKMALEVGAPAGVVSAIVGFGVGGPLGAAPGSALAVGSEVYGTNKESQRYAKREECIKGYLNDFGPLKRYQADSETGHVKMIHPPAPGKPYPPSPQ